MNVVRPVFQALCAVLALLLAGTAAAADPKEFQQAQEAAQKAARNGPTDVPMADQAVLHLPAGLAFVPQPQAGQLLRAMGNPGQDPRLQGVIFPAGEGDWFMTVRYESAGYVKDDDAKDWNADDLLKSYREGTEASNEERQKMGVPAIEVTGWAEKPAYDGATHRLVWAMISREKGAAAGTEQGVNYNTYALGREGYFSMNLVTGLNDLAKYKPQAHALLAALDYKEGKRYADFNPKTDHVAEYGLAALVVGAAAKKLGLLAVIAAFFAKFAKVAILAVAGLGAAATRLFKRKPEQPPAGSGDGTPTA
jgi:uncharacterized membrane-anchored protein